MNLEKLKILLRESGVVGAGGAGFPTYAKLDKRADTLILNCAECEPLLTLHRQVLELYTYEILSTLSLISNIVEADTVYIGIKDSYKQAVDAINTYLASFPNIKLSFLPEVYPAGDEVVLTYQATGKVVPAGQIPLSVGVTVLNVETVYNIYRAIQGESVTHKYVTVAGAVKTPVTLYAPIGTTVKELISKAGGALIDDPAYVLGGPMMGEIGSLSDTVTKTTNGILVLPQDLPLVQKKLSKSTIDIRRAMASCCQCDYCTSLCPRYLLGHPIDPAAFMLAASNGKTENVDPYLNTSFCCGCGLCEIYSCCQDLSPRTLIIECKNALRERGVMPPQNPQMRVVDPARDYRMIPVSRLRSRLGLDPYDSMANIVNAEFEPDKVKIKTSQHIGAPAVPCVEKNDDVSAGQIIATPAENSLSVAVHSSVDGKVVEVNKDYIIIKAYRRN